ncbi:transketolase C-terminal domain-containing protein [Hyphomicrobium sp. LHD-15]|uniref:alpha-ketoacid dehydrogenase subunit beta n=1 Tax=Hyphomicrobium sp. LHD-15 TaxID=3072142 RepID=UPI00280C9E94|nr:transketolase C-terminal domain-containing protein [Hyphomicrobium sp. LHD-15]MDQ8698798.1 transketolase C-terminal domain-containing protein [Hyphomicrobium sp. LHD-15]
MTPETSPPSTYLQSLNRGLHAAMAADERVHFAGEDVLDPYGGAFKVSAGLSTRFPERVHTTPISEGMITGLASGMALRGLKPVVEIMFGDFLTLTFDQIMNHAVKFGTMYGTEIAVPMVIRTPMGGRRGYGPTHSQSIEKHFFGIPGLKVISPSHVHGVGDLLGTAIANETQPVLFIEYKSLYPLPLFNGNELLSVEATSADPYATRIVRNFETGEPDAVLIGYGGVAPLMLEVAEKLAEEEISVSIVLPAVISPLDIAPIAKEVARARRALVVEEGMQGFDWGAEVAARLHETLFGKLDRPVRRLASKPQIIPTSKDGETATLISADDIEAAVYEELA